MNIDAEMQLDHDAVLHVHRTAFERDAEAALVDRLRRDGAAAVSLVARIGAQVVGHVLFSEAQLVVGTKSIGIGALGPVAVLPAHRRQGLAAALIREGLRLCWQREWPAVIVLGRPAYYGRFGFARADAWSIRCELDVPPEAFMIAFAAEPTPGPAVACYHPAFAGV